MGKKLGIPVIVLFTTVLVLIAPHIGSIGQNKLFYLYIILILISISLIAFTSALLVFNSSNKKRTKVKNIYLSISIFLITIGIISKISHFIGSGIELGIGVIWYSFAYAPLELKQKYYKWLPYSKNRIESFLLSFADFLGLNCVFLGILFKFQHWPAAFFLIILGASILIVGLFSWNYVFKKEVIKRKLSEDIVKQQLHEIQDSINYAKRIQNAILPSKKVVKEYLKDSFIFYKPKDIVAGDFYWMENVDSKILFAAADCTGHGVPGSIVSVICHNSLNRSVHEFNLVDVGQILDKSRELIIQEFEKSEDDVKDGMDIALCCLDGNILEYAGANNPLWIIRKDSSEIEEIKPNKQPIGKFENLQPFTTHSTSLNKGDTIYIFSDGFVDQFGGENGKKLKSPYFKKILLSFQLVSMDEQRLLLEEEFNKWKKDYSQVDDICVIGVRF
jgi:serine phosphatase RsbU (regulator of sigma subunit)